MLAIAAKWGVLATAIGEVTDPATGRPAGWSSPGTAQTVVDVPPGSLADDGPVYARPMREPADLILLQADRAETLPRPRRRRGAAGDAAAHGRARRTCATRRWVTEQYDRYVLGNTVLAQPEDAGVIRHRRGDRARRGALGRRQRPVRPARPVRTARKLALAEAYRNVAVTGATPIAVTNCLNFGSPEDPAVMWQFAEAVRGLADGCAELGIPVTGGNVSFYNQTGAAAIHPTPVVGVLGVLDDVARRVPMGFGRPTGRRLIFLLGETREELSGSEWAWVTHGHLGGLPPQVDLAPEQVLGRVLAEAAAGRAPLAPRTTCPTAGSPRRSWSRACGTGVGARIALPEDGRRRRSSTCSASPPAGRSWRCRGGTRRRSPRCATSTACRGRRSA